MAMITMTSSLPKQNLRKVILKSDLKHEKINLALVILVPMVFVLGLISGLLYEGSALEVMKSL